MSSESIPEEFEKIIKDFVSDLKTTFPEYKVFLDKWWKDETFFNYIENNEEKNEAIQKSQKNSVQFIFKYCLKKFPPRFFDILYKNSEIFSEDSETDTEFFPQIHFKNLWQCDISDKTRETIWKYLQLIMFTLVNNIKKKEDFGDTTKLFENIDNDEFKNKLQEAMNEMQKIFETSSFNFDNDESKGESDSKSSSINMENIPNADDIHNHISGILGSKLGQLAKEIAEETALDLNMDMDNVTDIKGVFQKMMQNPNKMMNLVKNVGDKLDTKMKSGDIKESELLAEASEMLGKMKSMPGMENIQEMLSKMGLGGLGKGEKINYGAMESQLNSKIKNAQTKERMRKNIDMKKAEQLAKESVQKLQQNIPENIMTDDEIMEFINENVKKNESENTKKNEPKSSEGKKKKKNKK